MKDEGCPTCGSKNFGNLEIKRNKDNIITWKKQCYNCKKFWHTINGKIQSQNGV